MSVKNNFFIGILVLLFLALSACSGGGGGSTPPPDTTNPPVTTSKSTFTGIIRQSSGNPLPGVTITLEGTSQSTTTDANGIFALPETLSGDYVIDIDGTTATGDSGTSFGTLKIAATVGTEETTSLNQVIILPDLSNPLTASISVTGEAGNIAGGIAAQNGTILLGSNGADVLMQIDGSNVQGSINVSATPVPLADLPMALPASAGANAGSFVTIQPPTATFDPALDLTIPNDLDLPPGTLVDIYSFDHDLNDWVNRSAEFTPPHQGEVSADGTIIEAKNVISKGGWNGPVVVIPGYIETVIGIVMNGDIPLQGVLVFTSSGQQGITGADGRFSILVPVPDISIDVSITATSNGVNGAISTTTPNLPTADDGSPLDFGLIDLTIPTTGIVSGVALQNDGAPSTQPVTIIGEGINEMLTPGANGAFTLSDLPAGTYTASTTFAGDSIITTTDFNIVTGLVTVITLQNASSNGNTIVVRVSLVDDNFANPILTNNADRQATVTLSQDGTTPITQTTSANGQTTFNNITGRVTITGQIDIISQQGTTRLASTIHDITPVNGQIGLPILAGSSLTTPDPVQGTAISGTISNIPPIPEGFELTVFAKELNAPDCCDSFNNPSVFIPDSEIDNNRTASYTLDNNNDSTGLIAGSYTVMAIIQQINFDTDITRYNSAAIRPTRINTTAGETSTNANLDFANITMKYEFTEKSVIVNNLLPLPSGTGLDFAEIVNTVLLASGEELSFTTFSALNDTGQPSFPSSASFITASPGGTRVSYSLDTEYTGTTNFFVSQGQSANLIAPGGATLTFNLIDIPVITSPTDGQIVSLDAANNMTASWSDPGSIDLVFAIISSFSSTPEAGDINMLWIHYLPGSSSLTIPPASVNTLPMFAPDTQNLLLIDTIQASGTIDFNQLFDFNFDTNLNDAFFNGNNQDSLSSLSFSIAP